MFVMKHKKNIPRIRYIYYNHPKISSRDEIKYVDCNDKIELVIDYNNDTMYVVSKDNVIQDNVIIVSKLPIVDKRGKDIYPYDILLHDRTKHLVYVDDIFNEVYLFNLELKHFESIKKYVKLIAGKFVFDGIQYSHAWEKDEYIYALKEAEELYRSVYNYFLEEGNYERN